MPFWKPTPKTQKPSGRAKKPDSAKAVKGWSTKPTWEVPTPGAASSGFGSDERAAEPASTDWTANDRRYHEGTSLWHTWGNGDRDRSGE